jgi:hypothetical protein
MALVCRRQASFTTNRHTRAVLLRMAEAYESEIQRTEKGSPEVPIASRRGRES